MTTTSTVRHQLRAALAIAAAAALGLVGALAIAEPAAAVTFTVTSTADSGPGSLRDAIDLANLSAGPDTIGFLLPGSGPHTLTPATPLPIIMKALTIAGPGSAKLVIDGAATSAGNGLEAGDCSIPTSFAVSISGVTITGFGADGIRSQCVDLTLSDVVSSSNHDNGINTQSGALSFSHVRSSSNGANGIAAVISESTATIDTVSATSNAARGAQFQSTGGATITIVNSSLGQNVLGGFGGDLNASSLSIRGTTMQNNGTGSTFATFGGGLDLVLHAGSAATLDDCSITGNLAGNGGGISADVYDSTLDIAKTHVDNNHAININGQGLGGGIRIFGVDGIGAHASIADSEVVDNVADYSYGGIFLDNVGEGGPTGGVSIVRTTIDGNHAAAALDTGGGTGGGLSIENWGWRGGADPAAPVVTVDQSTISHNQALAGGGVWAEEAGVIGGMAGLIRVVNSTISGNSAEAFGAMYLVSGAADATFELTHSTVANNSASQSSPGVFVAGVGVLSLDHSIVAGNGALDLTVQPFPEGPTLVVSNWSLVQAANSAVLAYVTAGTGNITGVDPKLGALGDNGGPTFTQLPAPSSPAVNAGNPAITGAPATDQRGLPRIVAVIDMGAVETPELLVVTLAVTGTDPAAPLVIGSLLSLLGLVIVIVIGRRTRPRT